MAVFIIKELYWRLLEKYMPKANAHAGPTLHSIMEKLPAIIFELTIPADGPARFSYLSPRWQEILGLGKEVSEAELDIDGLIHEADGESFTSSARNSVASFQEWKWEGRIVNRQATKWIEAIGIPSKNESGCLTISGLITEISERKILEQRRSEAEMSYQTLVEQLPVGVGIHQHGRLVYVNRYAVQLMAAKGPEELLGREVIEFVHPDDKEIAKARVALVLQGEHAPVKEEKYIRLDGKVINVEVSSHPFVYEGTRAIQVIVKDVTDRKEAEVSVRKAETLFSQLFQNSPMAIVMLNDHGTVVQINKGFEEMFGYTLEELENKELNQFIVPEGLETEGNDLNTLITSYQVIRIETSRIKKDGKSLSVIIYGVPVHLDETTIGIFGVYVDITERKKVEEELKIRNTELDNFVYKVSHDLRAPLSSILGLVNLAKLPGNDDNLKDYLPLVGQKVSQLDHFISDVLSHSKNLKLDVRTDLVDLQKVIEQTFTDLSYLTGANQIRKEIKVEGHDLFSDPWRIEEIFRNLVSNAIKYRRLDNPDPLIEVSAYSTEHATEISFKDNGIGIAEESLDHIFEMFYRASGQSEGSGLGLYIVKNAVDKLGGVVMVDSKLGEGTTFKMVLPNKPPKK
jgi:PAS domain S-box-containing protein